MKKTEKVESLEMDFAEITGALEELEKTRGISKDIIMEAIETGLIKAYKQNYDSEENVKIVIDETKGKISVFSVKTVVEEVEDPDTQISLEDAQKVSKKYSVGDELTKEVFPKNFGRISAGTAKQIIIQKIREIEREVTYAEYNDKIGEIIAGVVQRVGGGVVTLDLGKLEGIMPLKEQMPTESYRSNSRIKGYVMDVQKGLRGNTQIIVSRSHPDFLRKLLELEIPEIYEGLIEIKSISRDAGYRAKVAVYSNDPNIDPVGSCVGPKGLRIQNIITELNGEKIDVIEWDEDPSIYIAAALAPSQVLAVDINEEEHLSRVVVPDDQLSLAIGKAGQNAKLAAKLTKWKIDIKSESQIREMLQAEEETEGEDEALEESESED